METKKTSLDKLVDVVEQISYDAIPAATVQKAKEVIADQLYNGTYAGESMENELEAFNKVLLKEPVWHVK